MLDLFSHDKVMFDIIDWREFFKRLVKYLVEGFVVALVAYVIPNKSISMFEIMLIALSAAATFSVLDNYLPSMGVTSRAGAGFGIGAALVGFPG